MSKHDLSWLTARPIAHRGYHDLNRSRWENTLSAFEAAMAGDFAIECDVHLSADGVPVVFHDGVLNRLTGRDGNIYDLTAAELVQLRIGGTEDRVPTLAEMLARVAGEVPLVIELKGIEGKDDGLVAKVGALLADYPGKAAIMSFDHWLIRRFAADAPGIPAGLTAWKKQPAELEAHFSMLAHGLAFTSFNWADLPNPFVTTLRDKLGLPAITWTVRDEKGREATRRYADQMTFEGFDPDKV
ncbi:MAG: glycerophosphodiester phosphodiesterase [Rhizobiaceae bacterium]|nr:glycerophosphodiester phosphodiesterase [Rhizobiaceae bacterium]